MKNNSPSMHDKMHFYFLALGHNLYVKGDLDSYDLFLDNN